MEDGGKQYFIGYFSSLAETSAAYRRKRREVEA
jgi:hypothetical protein